LQPLATPTDSDDPVAALGQPLILLAEDEDSVRDVVGRLLRSLGCGVLPARNGEEAVALFQAHRKEIRAALIDLSMPRLDGEPTIRRLLALEPRLPVVLMSGYPEGDLSERLPDLKLSGYLQKPFRMPALVEMLKKLAVV
jgi:CheY-like chemotaxis protein